MRKNEFKLRQKDMGKQPVPVEKHSIVRKMIRDGISKKALCLILNCTYDHLKECR